jgi:NADH-quinone oxidoreductase subunit L
MGPAFSIAGQQTAHGDLPVFLTWICVFIRPPMLSDYPVFILAAPLAAGLIIGLFGSAIGPKGARLGVAAEVIAFVLALFLLLDVTASGPRTAELSTWTGGFFHFNLYADRLSAVMLVHIAAISLLIHLFSLRYMRQEFGYARFHSLLAFTTFVLFGMVTAPNLLALFVFWQLLSWLVPLLSYNYPHLPTTRGAFRTFVIQRFGDAAFLAAIVIAYGVYGTWDFHRIFARAAEIQTVFSLWPKGLELRAGTLITLLIFVGAMSKSAQFPLHMWLPDFLYAPTPVTALLHAGIINAGGFLLTRLAPLYALSPGTLHWVFAIGMPTALLGSSMMLVQSDIKKTLGYSTIGQMGFMIMECGLGAYGLSIFHLIAHGIFKGTIFLNCNYIIHAARQEPRNPPERRVVQREEFSSLAWITGFATTLILPLVIVLAAHGVVNLPLRNGQGTAIFLFFGWATSAQAILTLYRLKAVASWKVAASMLLTFFGVVVTYLFAAESFSHFLFSGPGEVTYHLRAAALPTVVFDLLVTAFALVIIVGWVLIYAAAHGKSFRTPEWVDALQMRLYLLLINRLYLNSVSARLRVAWSPIIARAGGSLLFFCIVGVGALVGAFMSMRGTMPAPAQTLPILLVGLILPLFPLHGVYVTALTQVPGYFPVVLAMALPAAGLGVLMYLPLHVPAELLPALRLLALVGALYASLRALAQIEIARLLAYASLVFYSLVWWALADTQEIAPPLVVFVGAGALVTAGLLLAHQRLRKRYGDLSLKRMHGLARPMPRFATVFSLLIMAAVGLPPFGLFFAQIYTLLAASRQISWSLAIGACCWFLASWYFFRMLQRLLFGPHRSGMRYEDLRPAELVYFGVLLLLLLVLGAAAQAGFSSNFLVGQRLAMELNQWHR